MKPETINSLIKKKREEFKSQKLDELIQSRINTLAILAASLLFGLLLGLQSFKPSQILSSFPEVITAIVKCQAALALFACYGLTSYWLIHWLIERKRRSRMYEDIWNLYDIAYKFVDENAFSSHALLGNGKTDEDAKDGFLALLLLVWARKMFAQEEKHNALFEKTSLEHYPTAYAIFLELKQAVGFMLYEDDFIDLPECQSNKVSTMTYMSLSFAIELCVKELAVSEENIKRLTDCFSRKIADFIIANKIN